MSEESRASQPVSLSQAKKIRRDNQNTNRIEVSEERLRTIMSEVVDEKVSSKIVRLENSINKMVSQFEGVKNSESEDAALRITTDSKGCDLALASVNLPKEELYPYTCGILAEKLCLRKHDVVQMVKQLNLRNNEEYHCSLKTGMKSEVQKWSEATYQRLKKALDSGKYPRLNLN